MHLCAQSELLTAKMWLWRVLGGVRTPEYPLRSHMLARAISGGQQGVGQWCSAGVQQAAQHETVAYWVPRSAPGTSAHTF